MKENNCSNIVKYLERLSRIQREALLSDEEEHIYTEAKLFIKEFGDKNMNDEPLFISKMREWYQKQAVIFQSSSGTTDNIIAFPLSTKS